MIRKIWILGLFANYSQKEIFFSFFGLRTKSKKNIFKNKKMKSSFYLKKTKIKVFFRMYFICFHMLPLVFYVCFEK